MFSQSEHSLPHHPDVHELQLLSQKRRREPQINLTQKQEDEDEDEDDHPYPQSGSAPDPCSKEIEVSPNSGVPCSDFPLVMKRILNRLHRSVRGIVALERANEFGEGKGQAQGSSFSEIVPHGQLQTLSAVPPDNPPSPIIEGCGVVKHFGSRSHVVPMHSDWFSLATVNRLERQAVPHFFSGKSPDHTPEKYMECRNYAVIKYTENPERMFTEYDFIGVVAGIETENLSQIVRFLDHWGIINYCVTAPCHEKWNSSSYLIDESTGTDEIHVASAALKSIDCLFKFDRPKCNLKAAVAYSSLSCHYNNVFDLDNRICEHLFESHCSSCSQSLPTVCYQSHKEVILILNITYFLFMCIATEVV
ncbi:hypothetical protein G4B88_001067 [Cannabis sativa]|uniref:SWIRM domain-containing protein n=1 Tax=Cannabis sativa TaxID=3483 RepID=A0A7J6EFR4_CANSA|nr:hypothetical protein G4B88_001067 [Cannabis sativa]